MYAYCIYIQLEEAFAVIHAFVIYTTQLGGETGVGNLQMAKLKDVICLMPIILIPITSSFPAVSKVI